MGKLLKYDFKAILKTLFPFSIAMFGMTIVACLFARYIGSMDNDSANLAFHTIIRTISIFYMVLFFFSFFAYAIICFVFILKRYYDHFYSDEGYLTFTLPVKPSSLLGSKICASFVCELISIIVLMFCGLAFILIGFSSKSLIDESVWSTVKLIFKEIFGESTSGLMITAIAEILVQLLFQIVFFQLCITVGSIIAKKHKILASIGIYYGAMFVLRIITTIIMTVVMLNVDMYSDPNIDITPLYTSTLIFTGLVYVAACIGSYILNLHLIRKKLNLN